MSGCSIIDHRSPLRPVRYADPHPRGVPPVGMPPAADRGSDRLQQARPGPGPRLLLRQDRRFDLLGDSTCSATTLRARRNEWIHAGTFTRLEQLCLEFYHRIIGLDLENLSVDGCIVAGPCGGEVAGKSPVDRGKQGIKRSLLVDGNGIPLGCVLIGANRHDSPLLRPTLEKLSRFGVDLPGAITVHLDGRL